MSVRNTRPLFNLKSPFDTLLEFLPVSNDLPLNEKHRQLKESISQLVLDVSPEIFGTVLLGLAYLCQIQIKTPKAVYLK